MKKSYPILLSFLVFLASIIFSSFSPDPKGEVNSPSQIIKSDYLQGIERFGNGITTLLESTSGLDDSEASATQLQQAFNALRKNYKSIEFLAEYLDPEFIKDFINGPPLLSLERNSPSLSILEPEGMQVLEELIYDENPLQHKTQINNLVIALDKNFDYFQNYQSTINITDRFVFEAVRNELIRIFSLGVTGFDTPMSGNAIKEAEIALSSLYRAITPYLELSKDNYPKLSEQIDQTFILGIKYLANNNDFDTFDRLTFLKNTINPLFASVLSLHQQLGIETYYETSALSLKHAVNYNASNLFSEDLLDPYYYLILRKQEDNNELVSLGRTLFFDPILSKGNERSCASCHQPARGFSDGKKKSIATGFKGTLKRNTPTLINAIYADKYFYDLRVGELENQIEHVIFSADEFKSSYITIFEKLNQSTEYIDWFKEAFPQWQGGEIINKNTLSAAISAYLKSLSGFNSPFDKYVRGETAILSNEVKEGFNLFMGKAGCGTCHFAPTFSGLVPPAFHESESEILGVPATNPVSGHVIDNDLGRYDGNLKERAPIYKHSFKTTTVRNSSLTGPYMHNGVYENLEEVIDFYNKGGGLGLGYDVPYQTLPGDPLDLSDQEQRNLISFMEALVDTTGMTNVPKRLPNFENNPGYNERKIGGSY